MIEDIKTLAQVTHTSCGYTIPGSVPGWVRQGIEQPGLVEGVPYREAVGLDSF